MRILITGAHGMLGRTLVRRWQDQHQLIATTRESLDVTDPQACQRALERQRPSVVVHCAATTAVDWCEQHRDEAFRTNALGCEYLAHACQRQGARLVAISTDYVFSGALERSSHEDDETTPRTVYGASKLAGELAIARLCADHLIARISWLYGPGGPSFLHTMLNLGAVEGPPLRVVADQHGNPTSTDAVADGLSVLLETRLRGVVHLSCEGTASWYDFACAIFDQRHLARRLTPCTTADYPRLAPRPAHSALDKRRLRQHGLPGMPSWQQALARFLHDHPQGVP